MTLSYPPAAYTYRVEWSDADQAYLGHVAEFASLAAHGTSAAAALEEITVVVGYVLEDLAAAGEVIPPPHRHSQGVP